jgi:hypothetical protein
MKIFQASDLETFVVDSEDLVNIQKYIDAGYADITDSWPPAPQPIPEPVPPTLAELQAQLTAIQEQINNLGS